MSRPPASRRQRRLAELLQSEISRILLRDVRDARVATMTTITQVKVSPDLKYATVFVSVLGSDKEMTATMAALTHMRGHIQHELAKTLELRYTPKLRFSFDDRISEGDRVLSLLKEVRPPKQAKAPTDENTHD